jgi:hypothetical protein
MPDQKSVCPSIGDTTHYVLQDRWTLLLLCCTMTATFPMISLHSPSVVHCHDSTASRILLIQGSCQPASCMQCREGSEHILRVFCSRRIIFTSFFTLLLLIVVRKTTIIKTSAMKSHKTPYMARFRIISPSICALFSHYAAHLHSTEKLRSCPHFEWHMRYASDHLPAAYPFRSEPTWRSVFSALEVLSA